MSVLVQHVLEKVKNLEVVPERMHVMIEQVRCVSGTDLIRATEAFLPGQNKKDWENFFLGQSYQLSDYYGRYLMTQEQWTVDEYLKELPSESMGAVI